MIDPGFLRRSPSGVTVDLRVQPRARRAALEPADGALKVQVTAPPEDGKANAACIEFFAKLLNVPRSSVTIASGETSRNKVIRVTGLSPAEVQRRLGV